MITIDEKILDGFKWKEAEKDIERTEEMIELIRQYPPQSIEQFPKFVPYESIDSTCYNF